MLGKQVRVHFVVVIYGSKFREAVAASIFLFFWYISFSYLAGRENV